MIACCTDEGNKQGTVLGPQGTVLGPHLLESTTFTISVQSAYLFMIACCTDEGNKQGTVLGPKGTVLGPQGTVLGPQGTVLGPQGTVLGPQGTVLGPHLLESTTFTRLHSSSVSNQLTCSRLLAAQMKETNKGQYLGHKGQYLGHKGQYLGHKGQYLGHKRQYLGHTYLSPLHSPSVSNQLTCSRLLAAQMKETNKQIWST